MKIQLVSDLHLEFIPYLKEYHNFSKTNADVLVLAGDTILYDDFPTIIEYLSRDYKYVIAVAGNHEYYHNVYKTYFFEKTFSEKLSLLRDMATIENVFFLENDICKIDNQRFLGTTLWFSKEKEQEKLKSYLNDFRLIKDFNPYELNKKAISFLEKNIKEGDIVITHHVPSKKLIPQRFLNDPMNSFFCCNLDEIIKKNKPKMWFFGHTHDSVNKKLFDTKMICNPHGYWNAEVNTLFVSDLIIDVK